MKSTQKEMLDAAYAPLDQRAKNILQFLKDAGFSRLSYGYFAGHSWADETGQYHRDDFPIPVITVKGLCDIELDFEHTSVTAKLTKSAALSLDDTALQDMRFIMYGVEDFQREFKKEAESIAVALDQLKNCGEEELFFSFLFPDDVEQEEILLALKKLSRLGFYY